MKTHLKGGLGQLKEGGVHKPFLILGGAFKRGRGFIGGFNVTGRMGDNCYNLIGIFLKNRNYFHSFGCRWKSTSHERDIE